MSDLNQAQVNSTVIDMTGQVFGMLTVLRRHPPTTPSAGGGWWLCRCACGTELPRRGGELRRGKVSNCGCRARRRREDLIGRRFGRLVVTAYSGTYKNSQGWSKGSVWRALCDCGGETEVRRPNLLNGTTRSCGCLWREALLSLAEVTAYKSLHTRLRRAKGPARGHRCVDCGEQAAQWSYDRLDPNPLRGGPSNCLYSMDADRYQPRCVMCHRRFDGLSKR